ncbi:hypothetical protein ACL02R_28535 [Streptomyces sp. MS19]|uniref:hypothetical protein n=1 Tax=Streptomyces sp. MS19 TaxID=3385972 RepID=UPI0039A021C3
MSSSGDTPPVREWAFVLYPEGRPGEVESDRFDRSDALAGGEIGWEEDPGGVRFPCVVRAVRAEDAVAWAVERLARAGIGTADVRLPLADFPTAS